MKYEQLFDSLSGSVWGKILAATVIGALAGLGAARKMSASGQLGWEWAAGAGGGAAIGLVAGLLLGLAEIRAKRVAAGISKPLSVKAKLGVVAGVMIAFFAVCLVIVFGPSFQLGSTTTPRVRPEFAMPETEPPEGNPSQPPQGDPVRRPTGVEPRTGVVPPTDATAAAAVTPVLPPPVAEPVDRQPPSATPPGAPIESKPPAQSPPAQSPPPQTTPPAKPVAPLAKPAAAASMQSVAGRWKLNKTLTTTLMADGSLKTNYPAIRDGKWTLTDGETVTIYTSKGVAVYTFRLDEKGTAGTGNWKDGSKASPTKIE